MLDLASLNTCAELTAAHAKQAASSSAQMRVLAERFTVIARPSEGCPKILMALARLVDQEWLEGPLRVEIGGDDAATTLTVLCDFGAAIRERILPVMRFEVPFDEFARALELNPALVLPLKISDEPGLIVLTPLLTADERIHAAPPAPVELDEKSLAEALRDTAPPPPLVGALVKETINDVPTSPNHRVLPEREG